MSQAKLLRLQASWEYHEEGGALEVGSAIHGARFKIQGLSVPKLVEMFGLLSRGVIASGAVRRLSLRSGLRSTDVRAILNTLEGHSAVVRVWGEPATHSGDLYDRQIQFFNLFQTSKISGSSFNRRLQKAKVVIVGLGGYGCWIALLCACAGIKNIIGIDSDEVEMSNLNRQILYTKSDVGQPKADVCKRALRRINGDVRFDGYRTRIRDSGDLVPFRDADFVFNPFGYSPLEDAAKSSVGVVAIAALRAGIPSLVSGGSWVGPLNIPGKTACYWCLLSQKEIDHAVRVTTIHMNRKAFAPRIAMGASLATWEASRFLSGIDRPPTLDGLVTLDLFHYYKHRVLPLRRQENCGACGPVN